MRYSHLVIAFLILVPIAHTTLASMADTPWPRYHGNARSTGAAADGTPFFLDPAIIWQKTVGTGDREENQSTPLIGTDALYVSSNTGIVCKLDPSDGSEVWRYDSAPYSQDGGIEACGVLGRFSPAAGPEEHLIQATGYDHHPDNHVFMLDAGTGAVLWSDHYLHESGQLDSLSSANMDSAGNFYLAVGNVVWANKNNWQMRKYSRAGSLLWSQNPSPETGGKYGVGGPCALSPDETISYWCSSEDLKIWALNNADGSIRWSLRTEKYFWAAAPAVNSQNVVYVANDYGRLYAVEGDTGALLWSLVLEGVGRTDTNSVPALREITEGAPAVVTRVYIASNGSLHCVEDDGSGQGAQKWSFDITHGHSGAFSYSGPVVTPRGAIYVASPTDGNVYAFFDGGDFPVPMWKMPVAGGLKGTRGLSVDTDGALYVNAQNGIVYKLHGPIVRESDFAIVNGSPLPDAFATVHQSINLLAVEGTGPFSWSVPAGTLPAGCTLDPATGIVSGSPLSPGLFEFTISVSDSGSPVATAVKAFQWNVQPLPLQIITTSAHNGKVDEPYRSTVFSRIGSEGPFAWSSPYGTIPPGLAFSEVEDDYVLSGTPTTEGEYTFAIRTIGPSSSRTYEYQVEIRDRSPWTTLADDPCLFPYRDATTPPQMNTPMLRSNMGAAAANGRFYVMCGDGIDYYDGSRTYSWQWQATFSIYNPDTDTWDTAFWRDWSALSALPGGYPVNGQPTGYNNNSVEEKPLYWMGAGDCLNHACVYDFDHDGTEEIFLFGGYNIPHGSGAIYDPDTNKWAYTPAKPDLWGTGSPRSMREGLVDNVGADMYLFGGVENGPPDAYGVSRELMRYNADDRSWTLLGPAPMSFTVHCGNIVNGRLYAISGYQDGVGFQDDVIAFDIPSNTWITRLAPIPTSVNRATSVVSGDKIIVLGGLTSVSDPTDFIQVYDTSDDSWTVSPTRLPMRNSAFAAAILGGNIIIADGSLGRHADRFLTNSTFGIPVDVILYGERPQVVGISLNTIGNVEITWLSSEGTTYQVESSTNPYGGSMTWYLEAAGVPGGAATTTWEDSAPSPTQKYYRVTRE